ncbi:ATP-binding protein [Wenjunlia tyrosinilytica]|nr:ATP-binding protein [Wenjunlia tyrosinilytica]
MGTGGSVVLEPLWQELLASAEFEAPGAVSISCEFELPPRFEAVKDARDFAMTTLRRWNLAELFDSVALVASELVTNALRHGMSQGPSHPGAPIQLCLIRKASRVVCAVRDPSDQGPVSKEPDYISESGRGLHLVDSFSDTWGWHPLAGAGKIVWALFHSGDDDLSGPTTQVAV